MAHRIEIKGPFSHVLLGLVAVLFAGNWLAPDLLAGLTGKGEHNWRLLRSGHVERYHRNLTGHWITAERGTYCSNFAGDIAVESIPVSSPAPWRRLLRNSPLGSKLRGGGAQPPGGLSCSQPSA